MTNIKSIHGLQEKHCECVCEWIKEHDKTTITMIHEIATNLVTHRRNVNIIRITWSVTLTAIGGMGIAILRYAPTSVIYGLSLAHTIVGASP